MTYFTKLKTTIPLSTSDVTDSLTTYGKGSIEFLKISSKVEHEMLSIIPEEYRKYFTGSTMKIINTYIPPHTDSYRKVGINFYIKTDSGITNFFDKKSDDILCEKVSGQTTGRVFKEVDLIPKGSFISKDGEIWILDVSNIHSVINPNGTDRIAYTLSSNVLSYDQTVKILKDLI
jgi:hypothetical protein